MDILSFALYHENNEVIDDAQNALNRKRLREEPITDSSDAEEGESSQSDPKRQVAASAAADSQSMEIKRSIYEQVSKAIEGSVPVQELCLDINDRDLVLQALQSLESDGKVIVDDDEVYLVD